MKKWILCYWCHPTGLMSPLANLNKHFSTTSHYSLKEHQLLASVMGPVLHPAVMETESPRASAAAPAFPCENHTIHLLIQPLAEEYSLMFTDVECTHYISHNPISKHVFHPHYINPEPINKQIEHSHSLLRYPLQKESYCTRIQHRVGLWHYEEASGLVIIVKWEVI